MFATASFTADVVAMAFLRRPWTPRMKVPLLGAREAKGAMAVRMVRSCVTPVTVLVGVCQAQARAVGPVAKAVDLERGITPAKQAQPDSEVLLVAQAASRDKMDAMGTMARPVHPASKVGPERP